MRSAHSRLKYSRAHLAPPALSPWPLRGDRSVGRPLRAHHSRMAAWQGSRGAPARVVPRRASPLLAGRPSARLRLDAQTGLVREVWVQELAVNEQPLLPEQLTKWVRLGSEGLSTDVATILRSLTPWLES